MTLSMPARLTKALVCITVELAAPLFVLANDPPPVHSPVSPRESLAHIVVPAGFKVELVAHEPNVVDPVAIRFDEDGRMWVVEMRDYPTGSADGHSGSRISVLEDADNDGFFEKASVFADGLRFATGVQPWNGGAFVTMAGEVAYMKDTNRDGTADLVETWFTGFAQQNTQLRANHPQLALDNHIYVANGLRGGTIVDARHPEARPVSISGMDCRFDPVTREFEAVSGAGQFGLAFDDYGNRFVSTNRNPAIHIVLEDRQLKKNPLLAVSAVSHDVAKAGEQSRVFPITRSWTTSHLHAGQFTAACGLEIYRGDALPAAFRGNVFVCEPTGHLVHREIMRPQGVTFTSASAYDHAEFFASRDEWCCPVNLEVGPDGALYVADMYRAVIEHPEWMPTELRERPDLLAGNDRGRIYRVVPNGFRRPPAPKLSSMSGKSLVTKLSHPNAWWRETAARLLLERQDKSVAAELRQVALDHNSHVARIHAIRLIEGLELLNNDLISRVLDDTNPRVVEQAIVAADSLVATSQGLRDKIAELTAHEDPRVRFQVWHVARPLPGAPAVAADRWEIQAMLIAAGSRGGSVLSDALRDQQRLEVNVDDPKRFIGDLARLAALSNDDREQTLAAEALLASEKYAYSGLATLLDKSKTSGLSPEDLRSKLNERTRGKLDHAFRDARVAAADSNVPDSRRCDAIDLLAAAPDAARTLTQLAVRDPSQAIRLRAIAGLAKQQDLEPWKQLLEQFSFESPTLQRAILDGVFARPDRISLLFDEIVAGRFKPTELDTNRATILLNHHDEAIKQRAQTVLGDATPSDRHQALADYRVVLSLKADPARGRDIFQKHCATCHRVADMGTDVAPNISDSREKTAEQLLTDIIQPNRAIDSNYFSYTAVTVDGVVHTGILAAETSTSLTLKWDEGKSVTLPRSEIDELYSNGVSLMPDGMEKLIPPQEMADLISFIKNWRYLEGVGNPAVK